MIYIFHGADSYRRREALEALRAELDEDGALATNTLVLVAAQTTPQEVLAACATVPFLGKHRLVILEGALSQMGGGARRSRRAAPAEGELGGWQLLVDNIGQVPETTALVFLDGDVQPPQPLIDALGGRLQKQEFKPPDNKTLAGWVSNRAREMGLQIEPGAARLLAQRTGDQRRKRGQESTDLWSVVSELEKLAAFAGGAAIREADVYALTPLLREQKGYHLCDAILERRPAAAIKLLHELVEQAEPLPVIVSTIAGRYRRLTIVKDVIDSGGSGADAGRAVGASGFALERQLEQAASVTWEQLRGAYQRLVLADLEPKQGIWDELVALEMAVYDLATMGRSARVA